MIVTITGGLGSVGRGLTMALGAMTPAVDLRLLVRPGSAAERIAEFRMEVEDSLMPGLRSLIITEDPREAFEATTVAVLAASIPLGNSRHRSDMLVANGRMTALHADAMADVADPDCHVLVVSNPSHTNCLIAAARNGFEVPGRYSALAALDERRAIRWLSQRFHLDPDRVAGVRVWGNHSPTVVVDPSRATLDGYLTDGSGSTFVEELERSVRARGYEVWRQQGRPPVLSAVVATAAHLDALLGRELRPVSSGLLCTVDLDGRAHTLVSSAPALLGNGRAELDHGWPLPEPLLAAVRESWRELLDEQEAAARAGLLPELLPGLTTPSRRVGTCRSPDDQDL